MQKRQLVVLAVVILSAVAVFAKGKTIVKVEVPNGTEDRAYKYRQSGLPGLINGTKTEDAVFMVNVIVESEHARLKCYEGHKGCSPLGPGTYSAEQEKDSLWISQEIPITHKIVKDHWKVVGSW